MSFLKEFFVKAIEFYQVFIGPLKGHTCRFYPTCSEYVKEAIVKYNLFKGLWLGLKRILRCHPFSLGGYDPVP